MTLCEFIGLIIFIVFIGAVLKAWFWCLKRPGKCVDWRFSQERRQIQAPILFPCRRKNTRRENEDGRNG